MDREERVGKNRENKKSLSKNGNEKSFMPSRHESGNLQLKGVKAGRKLMQLKIMNYCDSLYSILI